MTKALYRRNGARILQSRTCFALHATTNFCQFLKHFETAMLRACDRLRRISPSRRFFADDTPFHASKKANIAALTMRARQRWPSTRNLREEAAESCQVLNADVIAAFVMRDTAAAKTFVFFFCQPVSELQVANACASCDFATLIKHCRSRWR